MKNKYSLYRTTVTPTKELISAHCVPATNNSSQIKTLPKEINRVILPLEYNYATTGDLLVKAGDKVQQGQAISKTIPGDDYSIALHTPISGIVNKVDYYPVLHKSLLTQPNKIRAIEIVSSTQPTEQRMLGANIQLLLEQNNFTDLLSNYGIIGLGGAGFPTSKKIKTHETKLLIINAVECEEPISVDNCLILNSVDNILSGIELLHNIIKPKRIVIAIKETMVDAISLLKQNIQNKKNLNIELNIISDKYPNGYSKTLVKILSPEDNNYLKNSKHSSQNGIICLNVATIYSIEQAINHQLPLTNRLVTIKLNTDTKDYDKQYSGNYLLPIGTPIGLIISSLIRIDKNIITNQSKLSIKIGGKYMGYKIFDGSITDLNKPDHYLHHTAIEKTTQAIIIDYNYNTANNQQRNPVRECIKCSACETVCPVNLLPQQLYWFSKNLEAANNLELLESYNITNCIECGLCDTVCPSNIPLTAKFSHVKSKIKLNNFKNQQATLAKERNELLLARKEQKEQERFNRSNNIIKSDKDKKKDLLANALKRAKNKKQQNIDTENTES